MKNRSREYVRNELSFVPPILPRMLRSNVVYLKLNSSSYLAYIKIRRGLFIPIRKNKKQS